MNERKKLTTRKLIWTGIFVILLLILIWPKNNDFYLVNDECIDSDYYEYLNETSCTIEVTVDRNIDFYSLEVEFFDKNNVSLGIYTDYLFGYDTTVDTAYFSYIYGEAEYYNVIACYGNVNHDAFYIIFPPIVLICFTFLICFLCCRYKEAYYNGHTIGVYAGLKHHYIKYDGIITDTYDCLFYFTPIILTTKLNNGDLIEATISPTNTIKIKINGILCNNF